MKSLLWKSVEVTPPGDHHEADARVGGSGSGQIEVRPAKAQFAIAASAAQLQPSSSTGQHHGQRRSHYQVICQQQQRSAANSF